MYPDFQKISGEISLTFKKWSWGKLKQTPWSPPAYPQRPMPAFCLWKALVKE